MSRDVVMSVLAHLKRMGVGWGVSLRITTRYLVPGTLTPPLPFDVPPRRHAGCDTNEGMRLSWWTWCPVASWGVRDLGALGGEVGREWPAPWSGNIGNWKYVSIGMGLPSENRWAKLTGVELIGFSVGSWSV